MPDVNPGIMARLIAVNRDWSRRVDEALGNCRVDTSQDFSRMLRQYLRPGICVLDVGGGRGPTIPLDVKASYGLRIIGLDISQDELDGAPPGSYDQTICGDVCLPFSLPEVDLAISFAVTEHVKQPAAMYANIYQALRVGGVTLNFMPNKFAAFALLNACVPNAITKRAMNLLRPGMRGRQGFPGYYRNCYPSRLAALLREIGFQNVEFRMYYYSDYFTSFLPAHLLELGWQRFTSWLGSPDLCEAFSVCACKP